MSQMLHSVPKIPVLDSIHDGRHELLDSPLARESIPYVMVLGEERIVLCTYCWVDQQGMAGGVFFAFGPGIGDQPIVEAIEAEKVAPEQNFDNWKVGGLWYRQDLKFEQAEISFRGARVHWQAHFRALHPAYAFGFHARGCPSFLADDRIEQTGHMSGVLELDGRKINFDTTGARDHSWGTRDWKTAQHWKWLHAQAGDGLVVHFFEIQALARLELRGYVLRDGVYAEVTRLETDFDHDEQYRHTAIRAAIHDSAGRITHIDGTVFAHFTLIPGLHTTLYEGGMHCTIEGQAGTGYIEFQWATDYLAHIIERLNTADRLIRR